MRKTASIWLQGRTARIIVRDENGNPITNTDCWNNIASAQSWVYDNYPLADVETCRDAARASELNAELEHVNV
jgi:hypothetical protein